MTGSILQLVAYGIEDIFLTNEPQITYFKVVYKRHTNFSREEIKQTFVQTPDFGKQTSAIIGKNGDLMEKTTLVVNLPAIPKFRNVSGGDDTITKIAWVRYPGYSLIDYVSIIINDREICKHYGEWMLLWNQLFNPKATDKNFKKMVGDIPELTSYTNGKDAYTLYIPLQFWFCRSSGNALPLVSLLHSDVKINISLNSWESCVSITPTHYISCQSDLVEFYEFEYIEQIVDDVMAAGIFTYYDPVLKRLYYSLITTNNFVLIPYNTTNTSFAKYKIYGKSSNAEILPIQQTTNVNVLSQATYKYQKIKMLILGETFLLINYIFLDEDERFKFAESKHDYIIQQLYFTYYNELTGPTQSVRLSIDNPCTYLLWVAQQKYIAEFKDYYNYTYTYQHKRNYDTQYSNTVIGEPINIPSNKLINNSTLMLNGKERLSFRSSVYFKLVQIYQNCVNEPPSGVNGYFFSIYPNSTQISGTCNMSKIETIELKLNVNPILSPDNIGYIRVYAETLNILRIANGLGAIMFEK